MKNILLIGVGGTGSKTVDTLFQKINELGCQNENNISAIVFDTDVGDIRKIESATPIPMADNASVGAICDRIGTEYIKEWFPCDDKAIRSQEMFRGASQWRKKSYLAFLNLMSKPKYRSTFINTLEKMTLDPSAPCEVYVISSVAGGTGSGSFIPIALFAKRYLRKNLGKSPIINAMIALPDIYAESQTPENNTKIYANAYAIFRELNAINLVARGYNKGDQLNKKSPIKLKIGNSEEPNVGMLFDSMDKSYWTPDASPFTQVFILDKIPGITSITAHNIVLANSLYSLICTDIGDKFDSEISNHELLHSQNNGSGAIYAGISTSEMRFPKDTILDYIAHKKAVSVCENEWLTLHNAVEERIKQEERQAAEMGRVYVMGDTTYANLVKEELENDVENNDSKITDLVSRGTSVLTDENEIDTSTNTAEIYFDKLDKSLASRIPSINQVEETIITTISEKSDKKATPEVFAETAAELRGNIFEYFADCVNQIKRMKISLNDSIISLDKRKDYITNSDLCLVKGLLMDKGNFIHPVSALVQLTRLKIKVAGAIKKENDELAKLIKSRDVSDIPDSFLKVESKIAPDNAKGKKKVSFKRSNYLSFADEATDRFINIAIDADSYINLNKKSLTARKTDVDADFAALKIDALYLIANIKKEAVKQLKTMVYTNLSKTIDVLIDKYRAFFNRFDKERVALDESTKDVKRRDNGIYDSIINIYSSPEDKENIYNIVMETAGPATPDEILKTDNIVGKSVFESVFAASCAEVNKTQDYNDKDVSAIHEIFDNLIDAYKETIKTDDGFAEINNYNIIEAIKASCGDNQVKLIDKLRNYFSTACEMAKPSIVIDKREDLNDVVEPSYVTVFMISENTARYIKRHADLFEITLPNNQSKEGKILEACAEQFIRYYSGEDTARVAVVPTKQDNILYCTGEIMDISPLRVAKFNEIGEDNIYFTNYQQAIYNCKRFETEMWNPHLGNNLHLRGYLPYMNAKMEKIEDEKMVKALFYALKEGRIFTKELFGKKNDKYYFHMIDNDGRTNALRTPEGLYINLDNVSYLVKWFRNQADLIVDWSEKFDEFIFGVKNKLPNIPDDNQYGLLELKITTCDFMQLLYNTLFEEKTYAKEAAKYDNRVDRNKKAGPSIFDFAYLVKASEESGRDCDDAERIIETAYNIFLDICKYRANPELYTDRFVKIYKHEVGTMYKSLLFNKMIVENMDGWQSYVSNFAAWFDSIDIFKDISDDMPINVDGTLNFSANFDYETMLAERLNEMKLVVKKVEDAKAAEAARIAKEEADRIAAEEAAKKAAEEAAIKAAKKAEREAKKAAKLAAAGNGEVTAEPKKRGPKPKN